ncbi:hypothetical protein C8256_17770 [Kluyvera genomosp. 2]|uniref:Uncharacterized protein n=1 Tax=Kluyvera genomosp. 2 TaxID=2774054 RepID=A0A2T2XZ93_9ENTR|nr:hypothetical protein C8256_17770 [Kluyvera genomosp. 2]
MVVLVGLANDQIAQSGLSSLSVIYYSAQLFSVASLMANSRLKSTIPVPFQRSELCPDSVQITLLPDNLHS